MGNFSSRQRRSPTNGGPTFSNVTDPAAIGVPVAEPAVAVVPAPAPVTPSPSGAAQAFVPPGDAQSISLSVSSDKFALAYGTPQKVCAMLSIKAPPSVDSVKRPPLDVVCAVDRSGSMNGEKMRLMKTTLELLVKRSGLNADDRVGLVSFDNQVRVEMPLEPMTTDGRQKAEAIIKRIHAGATTNLSGGALKAIDLFDASAGESRGGFFGLGAKVENEQQSRTRAVMLFTDGLANEGIRDPTALQRAVANALAAATAKVGGPISLFSFGFGADHNEDCLRSLAASSGSGGLYYYIATADDIPNAFADCLGGLTSVVAQNATLSLEATNGAAITRVFGSTYTRDAQGAIVLGDLFAEDEKDVLLEMSLPALARAPQEGDAEATCLKAALRAFNIPRSAPDSVEVTLQVARPGETPADQPVNVALDAQRNRIEAAEAMARAAQLADEGRLDEGREQLESLKRRIAESDSAEATLSMNLQAQCAELCSAYSDNARYRAVGSKMSKMSALSNSRQRATHMNSDAYTAGAKRKASLKAAWFSSMSSSMAGDDSD